MLKQLVLSEWSKSKDYFNTPIPTSSEQVVLIPIPAVSGQVVLIVKR